MTTALGYHIGRSASAVAITIPRASRLPWAHSRLTLGMVAALRGHISRSDSIFRHWIMHSHSSMSSIGATSKGSNTWKATKTATLAANCSSTTAFSHTEDSTNRRPPMGDIHFPCIYKNSSHRDGAIYNNTSLQVYWNDVNVDITDRSETCEGHTAASCDYMDNMLQFFWVKLAESPISNGSTQVYGYIAARDSYDGLLNYVVKYSRDDPAVLHQGSLIQMTGPKRGISLCSSALIEFDMRIKNGEQEEDDMQLIDGAMECDFNCALDQVKYRIIGKCGAVDVSLGYIDFAVQATIEVAVSEVQRDFSLLLTSLVGVMGVYKEIHLFHGVVDQSFGLRRFVVAVTWETNMLLKFKVGSDNVEYYRSFEAMSYGCALCQPVEFEFGSVSAKVIWSTI